MTDTTDNALLPCPFCGGDASHNDGGNSVFGRFWWTVGCKLCGIWLSAQEVWSQTDHGKVEIASRRKRCFAAWNTRAPATEAQVMAHPNVQELVDALRPFAEAFEIAKNEGTRSLGLIEANAYYHLKGGSFRKAHTALAALTKKDEANG
jgi:hypothetical protein